MSELNTFVYNISCKRTTEAEPDDVDLLSADIIELLEKYGFKNFFVSVKVDK
jgi:hypothetical protein